MNRRARGLALGALLGAAAYALARGRGSQGRGDAAAPGPRGLGTTARADSDDPLERIESEVVQREAGL